MHDYRVPVFALDQEGVIGSRLGAILLPECARASIKGVEAASARIRRLFHSALTKRICVAV